MTASVLACAAAAVALAGGDMQWSEQFSLPDGVGGVGGTLTEFHQFDDGRGNALYVAGSFSHAGGMLAPNVAKFNGSSWSTLGTGLDQLINDLATHDFGSGDRLVAVGMFDLVPGNQLAQWDGAQWTAGPPGLSGGWGASIASFQGDLYLSSPIFMAGSQYYTRWEGAEWGSVGSLGSVVWDQRIHDDGTGDALFLAGLPIVEGVPNTIGIAKWDGKSWHALGVGVNGEARALATFDDGDGVGLYVGGSFSSAGGAPVSRIARWRNGSWTSVGTGFNKQVLALAVFDDGDGPRLYAGGEFTSSGSTPLNKLARWNGGAWEDVGGGIGGGDVHALEVFDADGEGPLAPALYVGGDFISVGGIASPIASASIARWERVPAACPADLDGSGAVDAADLSILLGFWSGGAPSRGADLDGDGQTGSSDLALLLGAWGACK